MDDLDALFGEIYDQPTMGANQQQRSNGNNDGLMNLLQQLSQQTNNNNTATTTSTTTTTFVGGAAARGHASVPTTTTPQPTNTEPPAAAAQALAYFAPEDPSDPLVEEMTCSVCMELLNNPSEIQPCTHMYCTACQRSLTRCPECRGPIEGHRAVNRKLLNLLDSIKGKCTVCDWSGTFGVFRETHRPTAHNQPTSPRPNQPQGSNATSGSSSSGGGGARHAHREGIRGDHRMRVQTLLANLQNIRHSSSSVHNTNFTRTTNQGGSTTTTSSYSAASVPPTTTSDTPLPSQDDVFNNLPDVLIRRIRSVFHELAEDVPMASLPLVQSSDRLFASDGITPRTVSALRPCVAYQACHQLGWVGTTSADVLEMFRISEVPLEDLPVCSAMTTVGALLPRPTTGRLSTMLTGANRAVFASMAPVVTMFQFTQWASFRSDVWDRTVMTRNYSIPQLILDETLTLFPTVATQALLSDGRATEVIHNFIISRTARTTSPDFAGEMVMQAVRELKATAVRTAASCTIPIQQILMRSREAMVATHQGSSYITLDQVLMACSTFMGSNRQPPTTPSASSTINDDMSDRRNMVNAAFGVHTSSGSGAVPVMRSGDDVHSDPSRVEEIIEPTPPVSVQPQQRNAPPSMGIVERCRQEQKRRRNAADLAARVAESEANAAAQAISTLHNIDPIVVRRIRSVFQEISEDVQMASLPLVLPSGQIFASDGITPRTVSALRPCVAYQACHQLGWVGTTSADILEMFRISEVPLEDLPVCSAMTTVGALLPRPTTGRLSEIRSGHGVVFASMAPVVTLNQFLHWVSLRRELWDRPAIAESYSLSLSLLEVAIGRFQEVSTQALLNEDHAGDTANRVLMAMTTTRHGQQRRADERVIVTMRTVQDLKDAAVRTAVSCTIPIQQILMRSREAKIATHHGSSYITLDQILRACACLRGQPNISSSSTPSSVNANIAFQYMTHHQPSGVEEINEPDAPRMGFFERRRKLARERQERERRAAEEVARNLALDTAETETRSQRRNRLQDDEYDQVPDLDTLLRSQGGGGAASSSSAPPGADVFPGERLTFFRRVRKTFVRKGDKK